MRKEIILLAVIISVVLVSPVAKAEGELIPDFYEEPGAGNGEVSVDPFSGSLRLSYVDISLPGNGGMDLNIHRTYTNHNDKLGARRVTGAGWSIHFGRVMVTDRTKLCSVHSGPAESVLDNPMVELPDGSMQQLFYADFESFQWISADRWKADCLGGTSGGILLTSPEGLQYTMNHYAFDSQMIPGTPVDVWYTTKITDRLGNEINITYASGGAGGEYELIDTVTASDNRLVKFNYKNQATSKVLLSDITAHGQTWRYEYTGIPGQIGGQDWLTTVRRPDNTKFVYAYYPLITNGTAGSYSMQNITYPHGAVESFTYDYVSFDTSDYGQSTVVSSKSQSGRAIKKGTWTYSYAPGSESFYDLDVTTINAPNGKYVLEHIGAVAAYNHGLLYGIGLPGAQKSYDLQGNLLQQTGYEWAFQVISYEDVYRPSRPNFRSTNTVVPIMLAKTIWRERVNYEMRYAPFDNTYLNSFDRYGNPLAQTERGGYDYRHTDFTYFHQVYGTGKWLIKKVKDETVKAAGAVDGATVDASIIRTYAGNGNLLQENKYGVTTDFTYYSTGDVKTSQNARNYQTTFSNYKRGTPQVENHPEGVVINRTVNNRGTIASETNGRGYTSSYLYDSFDRLKNIDFPVNSDVSLSYTSTEKMLTRGNYQETTKLDGFGRPICITKRDVVSGESILQQTRYNAVGQKVFESFPAATIDCNAVLPGTAFEYDVLNRLTRATHPDNTFKTLEYQDGNQVLETNERGYATTNYYKSYGDPDDRYLIRVEAPENITNGIIVNKLGQKTYNWQGKTGGLGYKRDYLYDSKFRLKAISHPETGLTQYGLDANGNIISKKVGSSPVTLFSYDGLDRQTFIDYPFLTPDVTFSYDKNNNIKSVDNSDSQRAYIYDENDNLINESIVISGKTFVLSYGYDVLDNLSTLAYPTGRGVNYAPDALGRATQVSPFVNSLTYYPSGQIKQMVYTNGQRTDYLLNSRLWTERITSAGLSNVLDYTYSYDVAGNVRGIVDSLEPIYNLSLGYDGVDRLTVANGVWGGGSVSYDHRGNIKGKSIGAVDAFYTYLGNKLIQVDGSASGTYRYDVYGNVVNNQKHSYVYNQAGNLTSSQPAGSPATSTIFKYDGNNMRVQRSSGAELTKYVYAANGNLIGEYGLLPADEKENFYLGSKMLTSVKGTPLPIANAGSDQLVNEGALVRLDGRASTTRYGDITNYAWIQLSGPGVTLSGSTSATPTFTASTAIGNVSYTFQLTVTNTVGNTSVDIVTIDVQIVDIDSDGLSDYWETQNFSDLTRTATGDEDGDGYTNIEEYQSGSDPMVPAPLAPITGFMARPGDSQNTLSWDPVARALAYDLYWSTTPGVTKQSGVLISNVASSYIHSGLDNGQPYYYLLVARNVCCETFSQEIKVFPGMSYWDSRSAGEIPYESELALGGFVGGKAMVITLQWADDTNTTRAVVVGTFDSATKKMQSEVLVQSVGSTYYLHSPDIVQAADGSAIAVWVSVELSTGIHSIMAKHFTPGIGWGGDVSLWDNAALGKIGVLQFENYELQIELDQSGNAIVVWGNEDNGLTTLYASQYVNSTGWGVVSALDVPLDLNGAVFGMASTGGAAVAYSTTPVNQVGQYFVKRYVSGSGWLSSELVSSDPTSPVVAVEVSDLGDVAVFWTYPRNYIDGNCHLIVKRYQSGLGWHKAEDAFLCGNLFSGLIKATYDANGDLVVAVPTQLGDPGIMTIHHNKFVNGTGWGIAQAVPYALEGVASQFFGYGYDLLPDDDGNVSLFLHEYASTTATPGVPGLPGLGAWPDYVGIIQHVITGGNELKKSVVVSSFMHDSDGFGSDANFSFGANGSIFELSTLPGFNGDKVTVSEYVQFPGAPQADAGTRQEADSGELVMLDGTSSSDSDGVIASYSWQQVRGEFVSLDSSNIASPAFTVPFVFEKTDLIFELMVKDDAGLAGIDSVTVTAYPSNTPPVANAGFDQIVDERSSVLLDGINSFDLDGSIVSYQWQQLSEPFAFIDSPSGGGEEGSSSPVSGISFVAPWIREDTVKTLRLTVTDGGGKIATDVVSITMLDVMTEPPVADARNTDRLVDELTNARLDGSASFGTEGVIVSYAWVQTAGPTVSLSGENTDTATFFAPDVTADTVFSFELMVTDSFGTSATDIVNVTVREPPPPPPPSDVTPPVTTASFSSVIEVDGTLFGINFIVNEAAITQFRITGDSTIVSGGVDTTNWQIDSGVPISVKVPTNGIAYLDYYSVDSAGNQEVTRTKVLQITSDVTPPVTTASFSITFQVDGTLFDTTFTVDETAITLFRVTGNGFIINGAANTTNWQTDSGVPISIKVPTAGTAYLDYYSVDSEGNQEVIRTEELQ